MNEVLLSQSARDALYERVGAHLLSIGDPDWATEAVRHIRATVTVHTDDPNLLLINVTLHGLPLLEITGKELVGDQAAEERSLVLWQFGHGIPDDVSDLVKPTNEKS